MFSVGETVVLQSKELPHHNGVHVVRARVEVGEVYEDRITQVSWRNVSDDVGYILEETLVADYGDPDVEEAFWAESALRKYHEPSDMSFHEMMEQFKKPLALS